MAHSCGNSLLADSGQIMDKKARSDLHCGMTVLGLRDILSDIMKKEVHILKPHAYMMAVAGNLLEVHEEELSIMEVEREEKECLRIDKLLEVKILKSSEVSSDECHGKFRALKKLEPKPREIIARCPSPSPIETTGMIDGSSRYHSSVFLDPSIDLDQLKKGSTTDAEPETVVIPLSKYSDPLLQEMSEQTSVKPLYELAHQVVYRTAEGCKGILSASPTQTKSRS